MILCIDIGNTNLVMGGYEGERLCFQGRCGTDRRKTAEEYALLVQGILQLHRVRVEDITGGILSSVVPPLRQVMQKAMELLTGKRFLLVSSGVKTGLNIHMDIPSQLGSDLVADAVGAAAKYPKPIVFFDMGTATTLSVIDRKGCYLGGMIMPGLRISVDALADNAAQLPTVTLAPPERVIGQNTVECMQSGAIYGHAAMLDGLIDRVEAELGEPATAVATGGLAGVILPCCKRHIHLDETLQLDGLRLIYEKNQQHRQEKRKK
jgi:type III pantothenate kinase